MAKLVRLGLSEQLGNMLRGLPVQVQEKTKTDCIYFGRGSMQAGFQEQDVTVRVFLEDGRMLASLRSSQGSVDFTAPFGTKEEQEQFAPKAVKAIVSRMS